MKCKHKNIIRQREYVSMDCYAFCVRCKDCNKLIVSEWSAKDAENELEKLINLKN